MGDPVDGRGTDCILLTLRILEAGGLRRPVAKAWWYRDLSRGDFSRFEREYELFTVPLDGPRQYAVSIFKEAATRGFGVVVDGGLVTCTPERGAHWISLASLPAFEYRGVEA